MAFGATQKKEWRNCGAISRIAPTSGAIYGAISGNRVNF
jgi:hypothetical protein